MHSIVAREPLEVVAIDFTVLEPASNGIENVLVMTDVYSKFTITVPTRNQTVQTVAKAFLRYEEDVLMLKSSKSYTRSTLSTNLVQRHIIPWETGNAKDIIGRCTDCYAH